MPQYLSLMKDNVLDTFVNHGNRDGIGLDIDWQKSDELSSNELDLITDAILQLEIKLGGGIGIGTGLWDADRDTGIQVEETADDDIIRFDTAGVERATIGATGIFSFQEYLAHLGDLDTYLRFTPDRLRVVVGGVNILDIIPGAVVWNEGGADVDHRWEGVGHPNAVCIQGSDGKFGLGTPTIPHGGVGVAMLALDGANASVDGPFIQWTTVTDDYPLMQFRVWSHDNIAILFDAYRDAVNDKSGDAGSNFRIRKQADLFIFGYDSGVAQGVAVGWNDGIVLDATGVVKIPNLAGVGARAVVAAADGTLSAP